MALTTVADIKAAVRDNRVQKILWYWPNSFGAAVGANFCRSWWGELTPTGTTDPRICTKTTLSPTDGRVYFNDPEPGNQLYLLGFDYGEASVQQQFVVFCYDRLWDFDMTSKGTSTTVTIPSPQGPDRNIGGVGNFIFLETRNGSIAFPTSLTVSYTNQDGVSGRTATFPNLLNAGKLVNWSNLAVGDYGVQSIQSYTIGGTSNGWLVIGKPIAYFLVNATGAVSFDTVWSTTQLTPLDPNACLSLFEYKSSGAGVIFISGLTYTIVEG
ncbi:MAG TPA: hypothetical protein PKA10_19750 [Selenomonadales bacterium]|nr:hypothetical protein [Selenomonadales bacterium]